MKIDYALPALQPEVISNPTTAEEIAPSFRDQLAGVPAQLPASWEQQLRLDVRPFTATYLAPPRRPKNLELKDPQTQRTCWRNMLSRHGQTPGSVAQSIPDNHRQSIDEMLEMLHQMQQMEDSIISQSVAIGRG